MPTGGLISEISHISTMNTPNQTGSMPAATTSGKHDRHGADHHRQRLEEDAEQDVEDEQDVDQLQSA